MPINPSINMQYRSPEVPTAMNALAQAEQVKSMQMRNALAQKELEQMNAPVDPRKQKLETENAKRKFMEENLASVVDQPSLDDFNAKVESVFGEPVPPQFRQYGDHIRKIQENMGIVKPQSAPREMTDLDQARADYLRWQMSGGRPGAAMGGQQQPMDAAGGDMPPPPPRKMTAAEQKEIMDARDMQFAGSNVSRVLDQAMEINKKPTYSGFGASTRAALQSNIPLAGTSEAASNTQQYETMINEQALNSLKTIFGGNPTEGERAMLIELQASVGKDPSVREPILQRARAMADRRIKYNEMKANAIASGEIYQPGFQQRLEGLLADTGTAAPSGGAKKTITRDQLSQTAAKYFNNDENAAYQEMMRRGYDLAE